MTSAQHSSAEDRWYTPEAHLALARDVLGEIDLDPASDLHGNTRVKAARYLTDGLVSPWTSGPAVTVWMNPPGGRGQAAAFWERLMALLDHGALNHAIVAMFSVEQLQTTQNLACAPMVAFPICFPRRRVHWDPIPGRVAHSPTHAAGYVYVPGLRNETAQFCKVFSTLGYVKP